MTKVAFIVKGSLTDPKLMGQMNQLIAEGFVVTMRPMANEDKEVAVPSTTQKPKLTRAKGTRHFYHPDGSSEHLITEYLKKHSVATSQQIKSYLKKEGFAWNTGNAAIGKMRQHKRIVEDGRGSITLATS